MLLIVGLITKFVMTGERVQVDGRPNGVEGGSRRRRSSLDSCDCDSVGLNGQPSSKVLLVKLVFHLHGLFVNLSAPFFEYLNKLKCENLAQLVIFGRYYA